jgi:hypothetical protein
MRIKLKDKFAQVCVWPGAVVPEDQIECLVKWFKSEFDVRIQYLETILTKPDLDKSKNPIPDSGNRSDVFFAVHNEDVLTFAMPKFQIGARWLDDAISEINGGNTLYPEDVGEYLSWK